MNVRSLDLETHIIQPGLLAPPIVVMSVADDAGARLYKPSLENFVEALTFDSGAIAGQNIAYDFGCIGAAYPSLLPTIWALYEAGRVHDIGIAATLNAIARGRLHDGDLYSVDGRRIGRYSLDELVKEWLGRDDAKVNNEYVTRYHTLEDLPLDQWPEKARQYPLDDANNTRMVALAQLQEGACENLQDLKVQAHVAFCLHLGSVYGLRTDADRVRELESNLRQRQEALKQKFLALGYYRQEKKKGQMVLVKNTAVVKAAVEAAYGPATPRTEKGGVSTERTVLEDAGDPVLLEFSEISAVDKGVSYLKPLREASLAPLNVRPNVLLATGRTSYEGIVQLLPRKGGLRECFVPRPGRYFCTVDYNAVELSTLAQVCIWSVGFSSLADAINDGKDPHTLLAADLAGVSYEAMLARVKAGDKALRQAGKAANFGFPGGMGAPKFVLAKRREGASVCEWLHADGKCGETKTLEWRTRPVERPMCLRCIETAEHLRTTYFSRWPEVKAYHNWINVQASIGTVTQYVSGRVRGGLTFPSAANTLFQGLAADGGKRALIALTKEAYFDRSSPLWGTRFPLFAHDEVISEVPIERAHEAAHRQRDVMVEQMKTVVPDVRISAEPALMTCWDKRAEPLYENGRLVAWKP